MKTSCGGAAVRIRGVKAPRFQPMRRALGVALICAAGVLARPPNIVFIMGDDMGYGDPRCYNPASKIPTPNMDRLAAEGIRFTDAHSPAAVCTPTRYGMLTGRYCWRTRLKRMVLWTEYEEPLIEVGRPTVASVLRGAGYRTAAVGKWHLGANFAKPGGGFVRGKPEHFNGAGGTRDVDFSQPIAGGPTALGFDRAFFLPGGNNLEPHFFVANDRVVGRPTVWRAAAAPTRPGTSGAEVHEGWMAEGWSDEAIGPSLTEQALRFIDDSATAQKPFFLYYASQAPHRACTPPDFARGQSQAGVRGDMVYELDWTIGRILAKLDERGLARDTLVIVTSDNGGVAKSDEGEDFGHRSCGELRGNKGGIYEGGHRVPFLVRWPARAPAGKVNGSLVVLTDMMATFAEMAGVKLPAGAGPDGTSIVAALGGATMDAAARPPVVLHSGGGQFAIRSGRWKLIFNAQSKPVELYDLEADLREKSNELRNQPELVARLEQEFRRIHGAAL
jgi:arylsulfatase A-like enzyme